MPEDEIEKRATEPDVEPVSGLGDPPGDDEPGEADGFVCMPADLVKE